MTHVNTSETAILNQMVKELREIEGLSDSNTFISAAPIWLEEPPGDQYVEIIPGAATDEMSEQGVGLLNDTVVVAVFRRLMLDQAERDTQRIADASAGILQLVKLIENKLIQSFLNGLALVPILPNRREAPERSPLDLSGWVMIRRVFEVKYLYSFPDVQSTGL